MTSTLVHEKVWTDRPLYEEAEKNYYESVSKVTLTPLAEEVAKARQRLIEIRDNFEPAADLTLSVDTGALKFLENKFVEFQKIVSGIQDQLNEFDSRLTSIESLLSKRPRTTSVDLEKVHKSEDREEDEDVDLFGSDSEEESEAAAKVREERLRAYNAKKSKKPVLIAKSSIILDIKPWDDETDMKAMEGNVRKIEMDGLLWGASKLVPLAYGIHKLQINCVIEDEKVSVDSLQEQIENINDFVQSVDVAAFNKI